MRVHLLLTIAIIQAIQVHSDEFGSRILGDHLLYYIDPPPNYAGVLFIPPGYPTTTRPELIKYIITSPVTTSYISTLTGGVGHTFYCQGVTNILPILTEIYGEAPKETLTSGSLNNDDYLLHMETFTNNPLPNKIIVINLKYPKFLSTTTINWLSVKDNKNNDPASVKVVKGGVGFKSVHLQLISRVGQSLNITVQLYGKTMTTENWPWYFSHGAPTDALLFKVYWVWDLLSLPPVKKNCGCKSGRLMTPLGK